jgi:micrococcal nuclease
MTRALGPALLVLAAVGACDGDPACGPASATVVEVIDGDTVVLDTGERVRYLLVDAPEATSGAHACFGDNASRFNRDLVLDRVVSLRYGPVCDDRFGRRLAYVAVDDQDVGRLLVERGYACLLYLPPDGSDRVDDYRAVEASARATGRGLWSACEAPCS